MRRTMSMRMARLARVSALGPSDHHALVIMLRSDMAAWGSQAASQTQPLAQLESCCCLLQVDFGYFGPPEEHTQWTASLGRRSGTYITPDNPSSEVCGEVAASFSAASIALKATDPAYADELVEHARQMYAFGRKHPGTYMKSKVAGMKDHAKHYPSSNWHDEMAWGALWLHFATGVSPPPGPAFLPAQCCSLVSKAAIAAIQLAPAKPALLAPAALTLLSAAVVWSGRQAENIIQGSKPAAASQVSRVSSLCRRKSFCRRLSGGTPSSSPGRPTTTPTTGTTRHQGCMCCLPRSSLQT